METGGDSGASNALEWVRRRVTGVARTPATGLVLVVAPLVFACGVAAAPRPAPQVRAPIQDTNVVPLAAVIADPDAFAGPSVVPVSRPPTSFHVAAATVSAPPPAVVVNSPGALRIPAMALSAYRNAERMMAMAAPGCGVSWNLLAGIGRIESMHANGGATDARGTAVRPIYGPALDGTLPGNEIIVQGVGPAGRPYYARALGPMQFLPGTWARYASDGDGDGKADPQNLFDSTLAAGRYLCTGGLNLRDPSQVLSAILRYNNSMPYARNVLGWAAAYATGVVPVDLPAITGPIPPMGDAHLESGAEGLGPGMPVNMLGLPMSDPLTQMQVINFGSTDVASQMPSPLIDPALQQPGCGMLVCYGQNALPAVAPSPYGLSDQQAGLPQFAPPGALPGPAQYGPAATQPGPAPYGPALPGPAPYGPASPSPAVLPEPAPLAPSAPLDPAAPAPPLPASPGRPPGPAN